MYIGKASEATEELYNALGQLIPQLSAHKDSPTKDDLTALLKSESSTLVIARYPDEKGEIVGILNLTLYRVPTGIRSIIEDVVVDEKFRRRGIAVSLVNYAIDFAREAGADGVALTSNPKREAANKLYQGMGFVRRETNTYYYGLK